MLSRQTEHSKESNREEDRFNLTILKCMSIKSGHFGIENILAKKSISMFLYSILYLKIANRSLHHQCVTQYDESIAIWHREE